jgi:hypothetical protein
MDTKLRKDLLKQAKIVARHKSELAGVLITWQQVLTQWMNRGMKTAQKEMS